MAEENKPKKVFSYPNGIANSDNAFYKNRKIMFMPITGQSLVDKGKYYYDTKNNEYTKEGAQAKCVIVLPLPNDLSESQQHDWSESTYLDAITGMLDTSNMNSKPGNDEQQDNSLTSTFGRISASLSMGLGAVTNMIGTRKPMINPGYFQNYSKSQLRSFTFDYKFIPKNRDEAIQICEIVRAFKQYSSPQLGLFNINGEEIKGKGFKESYNDYKESLKNSKNGVAQYTGDVLQETEDYILKADKYLSDFGWYNNTKSTISDAATATSDFLSDLSTQTSPFQMSPFVWNIIIFNESIKKLSLIKTCACTSINVRYGEGNFDAFEDGMPKVIGLQLNFNEMDLQFFNKYQEVNIELQSNNPNASSNVNEKGEIQTTKGQTDPKSSDMAGATKDGKLIPKEEDGKTGGFIDNLALAGSEIVKGIKEFSQDVKSVADVVTGTVKEVTGVINEVHDVVYEVTGAVRMVNNTIEDTAQMAKSTINQTTSLFSNNAFRL